MCEPVSMGLLAAGAVASLAGTTYSMVQQNNAAQGQMNAQGKIIQNQNNAFMARNQAQNDLAAATGEIQRTGLTNEQAAADTERATQTEALRRTAAQAQQVNQQAQALDERGQTLGQTLTGATSGPALQEAQAANEAARAGSVAPTVQGIAVSNPLAATASGPPGNAGDSATQSATLRRMAEAATSVRDYASRAATTGAYSTPGFTTGQAIQANATGLMPLQMSEKLLQASEPIMVLPYQTQYGNATSLGEAARAGIRSDTAGYQALANLRNQNAGEVAGLSQADHNTQAQTEADVAALKGKQGATLGQLVASLGQLASYGGGYLGAGGTIPGMGGTAATYGPQGSMSPLGLKTGFT